jgi:pyruvate,water dikinase
VVRGIVTVVRDPRNAQLPAGRILVAEHTDPGWIMLFPSAKGLLVERGSLLSHSAIVAREIGIPAVVSIRGLTEWLRDGDEVELDGARGTVRRLHSGDSHAG